MDSSGSGDGHQPQRDSLISKLDRPVYVKGRGSTATPGRVVLTVLAVVAGSLAAYLLASRGVEGALAAIVLSVVWVVGYVVWRRARNRRLTGSPTTFPESDL